MLAVEQINVILEQQKDKYMPNSESGLTPEEDAFGQAIVKAPNFELLAKDAVHQAAHDPMRLIGFLAMSMFIGYQIGKAEFAPNAAQQSQLIH